MKQVKKKNPVKLCNKNFNYNFRNDMRYKNKVIADMIKQSKETNLRRSR